MNKKEEIESYLDSIKNLNILIVGDTIIDEYQYGYTLGKSGKSPIVAFQNESKERYDGGVLAIYNHLKEFCNVDLYTNNIVIKRRYIEGNQKLFETYSYEDGIHKFPIKSISEYDIVLIADFGNGFIDKKLQLKLESEAKYIALNTQFNAGNMGMNTINKYTHRDYICIDHVELRIATSNQYEPIEKIIKDTFNHETVSITEGEKGSYIYRNNEIIHSKPLAKDIVDTVGAGDAYFSLTTPFSYIKAPLEIIGLVGNIAGAIACKYPGNKEYVTRKKFMEFLENDTI